MDRLQTKCLVASLGFHALLVTVVLACSAVQWHKTSKGNSRETEASILQLVTMPADLEAPAAPTAYSASLVPRSATPDNSEVRSHLTPPATPSTESLAPRHRELSRSVRTTAPSNTRLLELSRALEDVASRVPAGKAIALELSSNNGGKEDAYARIVKFLYSQSWDPAGSENVDSKAAAKAKITIASDGKVSSASITESSGDARLDESVRKTLDRVQFVEPFEPGSKESERTYTINFSLHSALSAGP